MSKLLKSKILLGVFIFALVLSVGVVSALAADGAISKTLRYGMKDVQVKYLQQTLNETGFTVAAAGFAGSAGFETSFFGNATKAAVKAYQTAKGLVSDGIFGPASRGALGSTVVTVTPVGQLCPNGMTLASNCTLSPTTPVIPVVNPTGPVTVALATDTPASRSVVLLEAGADLAHYTFSGSGTVTNVTLKRVGISADASLLNVYLYDGAKRLTDAASVSSNSVITFNDPNGLFTVSGSKTISVKADMNATAGETIGVSLTGYTALSQTAVVLATPSQGNLMSAASASLASVTFGTVTPAANSSLTPAADITVWSSQASVVTRDVKLSHFTIREVGGIAKADLQNLRLYVDGVVVGTVANPDANGYATFVPSSPLTLKTGSHTIKVVADVMGGSSLSFTFSIRNKTDIGLVDSQYGVGLLTSTAVGSLTGFLQTVASGQIVVEKAVDSPSSTVVLSGTDVLLAKFKATTYGEKVKVDGLTVDFTSSNATAVIRNGRVLINGAQVGSTANIDRDDDDTATDKGQLYNVNYTFEPGVSYIEVRGDIYAASGTAFANGHTILVNLYGAGTLNNAQGLVSGDATLDVPGTDVAGNTLTVGSGSMVLAKDQAYGNQSVVVPTTATLLGSWTLTAGTNEALNLDTIQVDLAFADEFAAADLTNVYVVYGSKTSSTKATVSATAAANTWSISESLAANASMTFKVYGNIATGAVVTTTAADTVIPSLLVSGTSVSGTAVNTNSNAVLAGQTITAVNSGTLSVYLDANTPVSAQVVAGSTDAAGALKLKLSATNEDTYVKLVKIYADTTSNSTAISSMNLAWSATSNGTYATVGTDQTLSNDGTNPGYSTWNLTGSGRVTVPKNGSVYLKVTPSYVSSGQTAVSGKTPKLFLGNLQAEGTAVLAASGTSTGTLINSTGIIVHANSTAVGGRSYVDTTANNTAANTSATATTVVTSGLTFLPGDVIFLDEDNGSDWDPATEELMVVLLDGGTDLTVLRGAFGTTAQAYTADAIGVYRLNTATMATNAGIVGNAMTVLNTKIGLALSATSPSGATSAGSDKIVFAFTASAANNSADAATNTATITYVDITATESGTTTLNDLKLYPSEYDTNSTYATTCGALTVSKWRCTLSTAGNTNQIDENSSRTYIVRGDTAYAANGSIDISLAALGTSSDSANSVYWTDGTTAQYWVNQATTYIQSASPLSSAVASGTADVTAPTIASIVMANGATAGSIDNLDSVVITYSEVIDPTTVHASLVPGGSVTGVTGATTVGNILVAQTTGIATVYGVTTFDTGDSVAAAVTATTMTYALDSTGKALTLTFTAMTGGGVITVPNNGAGTQIAGVKDVNANNSGTPATPASTGAF